MKVIEMPFLSYLLLQKITTKLMINLHTKMYRSKLKPKQLINQFVKKQKCGFTQLSISVLRNVTFRNYRIAGIQAEH